MNGALLLIKENKKRKFLGSLQVLTCFFPVNWFVGGSFNVYDFFFFFFDRNDFSFNVYDFNKDGEWRASQEWFFHHIILEKSVSIMKEGQKQYYLWDMDIGNEMWTQNEMHSHHCIERKKVVWTEYETHRKRKNSMNGKWNAAE